jgi:NAD(P) transhydrogenase subunit alpha
MHKTDAIITTALVPGRPAPRLVSAEAVHGMKPGSVVVDLAGEAGGNCELTRPGETYTTPGGVRIAGPLNLPSEMAEHASALYARNVLSLVELGFDFDDEVVAGATVVREGKVV